MRFCHVLRVYDEGSEETAPWEKRAVLDGTDEAAVLAAYRGMFPDLPAEVELDASSGFIQAKDFLAHRIVDRYEVVPCIAVDNAFFRLTPL